MRCTPWIFVAVEPQHSCGLNAITCFERPTNTMQLDFMTLHRILIKIYPALTSPSAATPQSLTTTWLHRSGDLFENHFHCADENAFSISFICLCVTCCHMQHRKTHKHEQGSVSCCGTPTPTFSGYSLNCCFIGIIRAVRCVSTEINNTDSSCKSHFSIWTQSGAICGGLQLCDEQRGTERNGEGARGACGLTNEYPGDSLSSWGKNGSMMVRTTFKLSFMCDNSLPVWANIKTGWGPAQKTNRQPLTLIIGLSKLESGYKGKTALCWGPLMDSSWECVRSCLCPCYLSTCPMRSDCVSTSIKTYKRNRRTLNVIGPETEVSRYVTFVSVSKTHLSSV